MHFTFSIKSPATSLKISKKSFSLNLLLTQNEISFKQFGYFENGLKSEI